MIGFKRRARKGKRQAGDCGKQTSANGNHTSAIRAQYSRPAIGSLRSCAETVCRLLLAVTFILSGFVKAVDPMGTQYKIDEYLEAWGMAGVMPGFVTLTASVLLSSVEFSLGVALLFAIRRRRTSVLVLAIMAVMTPLTLWLALADPISDCGCFGDAVKLTNWQTLWKNIVLLGAAIVVWRRPMAIRRLVSRSNQWIVMNFTVAFIVCVSAWSLYDLPQFDFRPYHVGADIKKGMEIPEGAPQPQFETTFIMEKNGERREFALDDYPDSTWTFVDSRTVQTAAGYVPPIHDFSITSISDGKDITDSVLSHKGYTFLLVSPHLEQADDSRLDLINQVYEYADEYGYPFYCLTASSNTFIKRWRDMTGAEYEFCATDETTLKTIIRSNPGLVLLKDGTVVRKWSHNRVPEEEELEIPLEESELGQAPEGSTGHRVLNIVLWYVLPLTLLTLADRMWAWSKWVRKKKKSNKIYQLLKTKENEKENRSRKLEDEHEPAGRRGSGQGTERDTDSQQA